MSLDAINQLLMFLKCFSRNPIDSNFMLENRATANGSSM